MDTSNIRKRLILSGHGVWVNRISYYKATKKWLHLRNPKTWSEKLFWLNEYWQPEEKSICADKYRVRDWVAQKGYPDILLQLLGVYDKAEDIVFEDLPNRFVLKCNHGSGMNIVIKDKNSMNLDTTKCKICEWMKKDFSVLNGLELQYRDISRKIIAEEYIEQVDRNLLDYKIS